MHPVDERLPELSQQGHPVLFAARNGVQLVFEACGEIVVDVLFEMLQQERCHDPAGRGRGEAPVFQIDVLAVFQSLDDRGIGRRSPDAVLFQRLDQARLRVARRRLGEVLFTTHFNKGNLVALVEFGQAVVLFGLSVLVDLQEAGLDQGRS